MLFKAQPFNALLEESVKDMRLGHKYVISAACVRRERRPEAFEKQAASRVINGGCLKGCMPLPGLSVS